MSKTATLVQAPRTDPAMFAVLRFVLVSGCASALILARYPVPF